MNSIDAALAQAARSVPPTLFDEPAERTQTL